MKTVLLASSALMFVAAANLSPASAETKAPARWHNSLAMAQPVEQQATAAVTPSDADHSLIAAGDALGFGFRLLDMIEDRAGIRSSRASSRITVVAIPGCLGTSGPIQARSQPDHGCNARRIGL